MGSPGPAMVHGRGRADGNWLVFVGRTLCWSWSTMCSNAWSPAPRSAGTDHGGRATGQSGGAPRGLRRRRSRLKGRSAIAARPPEPHGICRQHQGQGLLPGRAALPSVHKITSIKSLHGLRGFTAGANGGGWRPCRTAAGSTAATRPSAVRGEDGEVLAVRPPQWIPIRLPAIAHLPAGRRKARKGPRSRRRCLRTDAEASSGCRRSAPGNDWCPSHPRRRCGSRPRVLAGHRSIRVPNPNQATELLHDPGIGR